MSFPNPKRRHYRRFGDERIWREFMCAILSREKLPHHVGEVLSDVAIAARFADEAYKEYRERFPTREPELDDEPAADSTEGVRPQ